MHDPENAAAPADDGHENGEQNGADGASSSIAHQTDTPTKKNAAPSLLIFRSKYVRGGVRFIIEAPTDPADGEALAVPRFVFGAKGDEILRGEWGYALPAVEAWAREYTTDAHCVAYHVPGMSRCPRINKSGLRDLAGQGAVMPVLGWCIADVDNPAHARWPDDPMAVADAAAELREQLAADPFLRGFDWYLSRGGYRLVRPFTDPLTITPTTEAFVEATIRSVFVELQRRGIEPDFGCSDWTRLYRLPFVRRDGRPQRWPAKGGDA